MKERRCCGNWLSIKARFCPRCGRPFELLTAFDQPSATRSESIKRVEEIAIDQLSARDNLLIQTRNSTYSFSVIDPINRVGILSGGADERDQEVTLVGMRSEDDRGVSSDYSRLRTHSSALFYFSVGNTVRSLITSTITSLVHIKSNRPASRNTLA